VRVEVNAEQILLLFRCQEARNEADRWYSHLLHEPKDRGIRVESTSGVCREEGELQAVHLRIQAT
jgi:hypothetical protein